MVLRPLANKDKLGPCRRFIKQVCANQAVVEHYVGHSQAAQSLDRNQFGVSWASANQIDLAIGTGRGNIRRAGRDYKRLYHLLSPASFSPIASVSGAMSI